MKIRIYYVQNPKNEKTFKLIKTGASYSTFGEARIKAISLKENFNYKYGIFIVTKETYPNLKSKVRQKIIENTLRYVSYV